MILKTLLPVALAFAIALYVVLYPAVLVFVGASLPGMLLIVTKNAKTPTAPQNNPMHIKPRLLVMLPSKYSGSVILIVIEETQDSRSFLKFYKIPSS